MDKNFLGLINQIKKQIDEHDKDVSDKVKNLANIMADLNYSKRKVNDLIKDFDSKTLDEKSDTLLDINYICKVSFDEKDAMTLIRSCRSQASEEEKANGIKLLNRFIADLDRKITQTQNRIGVENIESKYKKILSYFDETTGEMIRPIDDSNIYNLLSEFLFDDKRFTDGQLSKNSSLLSEITMENLRLFKARDAKLLELKKKEVLLKQRKQVQKQKVKPTVVTPERENLTEEQKSILETVKVILSENTEFFDNVPSEVAVGFEMIKEENSHYYELADNNTNLHIALLDLNDLVKQIEDNKDSNLFDILKTSILEYRKILSKISLQEQIRNQIADYIKEQEIDIDRIKELSDKFLSMSERLTDSEKNLLITIGGYVSSDISEDEKIESINQICKGSEINLSFYKEYKLLEEIYNIYRDYEFYISEDNSIDSFEEIQRIIDKMDSLLDNYENYRIEEGLLDYAKNHVSKQNDETPNDIMYLIIGNESMTGIEAFINEDSKHQYKHRMKNIKKQIEFLSVKDKNDIHKASQHCEEAEILGADKNDIRKVRGSDFRICFANINTFKLFSWPSDKQCYLVLFAGFKKSHFDVYDHASSTPLKNATIEFLKGIQTKIDEINSEKISDEAKKEKLEKFRIELLKQNHDLFNQSMQRLEGKRTAGEDLEETENLEENGGLKHE